MRLKMFKNTFFPIIIGLVLILISCGNGINSTKYQEQSIKTEDRGPMTAKSKLPTAHLIKQPLNIGANQTETYLKFLKGKRVGVVGNQSSVIFKDSNRNKDKDAAYTHLVDSLLTLHINIIKVFSPEHGFRGTADAGEEIKDGLDTKTNLPIISLYGDNKKPKLAQLQGLDILVFDIQDVGVRFYTYISTLHYVMEACAEANIPLLILDRPNPNGHYVDGPILEKAYTSFVGMHPIPIAHGMTIAEYAQMVNGEKWLKNGVQCKLTLISVENYTHQMPYSLPIKPSPNLPNNQSIALYPSLCFFEGTNVSVGRGTDTQFQVFGSPDLDRTYFTYRFTPLSTPGAKSPPQLGKLCYGRNLTQTELLSGLNLEYIIEAYTHTADKTAFFNSFFVKLAGTAQLQKQIEQGFTEQEIKTTWTEGLEAFKKIRERYVLYP